MNKITHISILEKNALSLQRQLHFHVDTYHRTKANMTQSLKNSRLITINSLERELIDTMRKLKIVHASRFPTPTPTPTPTPPTKGEFDLAMIYTDIHEDYND